MRNKCISTRPVTFIVQSKSAFRKLKFRTCDTFFNHWLASRFILWSITFGLSNNDLLYSSYITNFKRFIKKYNAKIVIIYRINNLFSPLSIKLS